MLNADLNACVASVSLAGETQRGILFDMLCEREEQGGFGVEEGRDRCAGPRGISCQRGLGETTDDRRGREFMREIVENRYERG